MKQSQPHDPVRDRFCLLLKNISFRPEPKVVRKVLGLKKTAYLLGHCADDPLLGRADIEADEPMLKNVLYCHNSLNSLGGAVVNDGDTHWEDEVLFRLGLIALAAEGSCRMAPSSAVRYHDFNDLGVQGLVAEDEFENRLLGPTNL